MFVLFTSVLCSIAYGILSGPQAISVIQKWTPLAISTSDGVLFRDQSMFKQYVSSRLAMELPNSFSIVSVSNGALYVYTCTVQGDVRSYHIVQGILHYPRCRPEIAELLLWHHSHFPDVVLTPSSSVEWVSDDA